MQTLNRILNKQDRLYAASMYSGAENLGEAKGFQSGYDFAVKAEAAEQQAAKRAEDIKKAQIATAAKTQLWREYGDTEENAMVSMASELNQLKGQQTAGVGRQLINDLVQPNNMRDREEQLKTVISVLKNNPNLVKTLGIQNLNTIDVIRPSNKKDAQKVLDFYNAQYGTDITLDDSAKVARIISQYPAIKADGAVIPLYGLQTAMGAATVATPAQKKLYEVNENKMSRIDQTSDIVFQKKGTTSVADRLNNPLNIRYGAYARKKGGKLGDSPESQASFDTWADGIAAAKDLLTGPSYRNKTVAGAIERWAEHSPPAYSNYVLKRSGVPANLKIRDMNQKQLAGVIEAMYEWESGNRGYTPAERNGYVLQELKSYEDTGRLIPISRLNVLQSLAGDQVTTPRYIPDIDRDTALMKNYRFLKEQGIEDPTSLLYKPASEKAPSLDTVSKVFESIDRIDEQLADPDLSEDVKKTLRQRKETLTKYADKLSDTAYGIDQPRKEQNTEETLKYTFKEALKPDPLEPKVEAKTRNDKSVFTSQLAKKVDTINTQSEILPGLYRLREKLSNPKWDSGMIDNAVNYAKSMTPDEISSKSVEQIQAEASIDYEAAAYLKLMSGASATDKEFQIKLRTIAGLPEMQPSERLSILNNFIDEVKTGIRAGAVGLGEAGLPVTARKILKRLEEHKKATQNRGGSKYSGYFNENN